MNIEIERSVDALHAQLRDEAATLRLGTCLAASLAPGLRIYLKGDLGAGKTTLVRGTLRALGYAGRVKSPTYQLVELYRLSSLYLHHFDFYRFEHPEDWADAGFRDAFDDSNVCIVEWPEKAGNRLPLADVQISLEIVGSERKATLAAFSERGRGCLDRIEACAR